MSSDRETTLRDAVIAFLAKWPDAKKAIDSVCLIAHVHGAGYSGPTLGVEIEAMQAALASTPPASVPVEPSGRLRHHDVALLGQASGARRRFGGVRGEGMSERETALSRSQIATLRELADDLSQIVMAVSSRDGDATARQHQRAEAVRAAVKWFAGADPVPVCQWREIATAPKDGTQILVSNGASVMAARWLDGAWYEVNNDLSDVWGHPWWEHETTHWMPLPAPPVALVPAEGDR